MIKVFSISIPDTLQASSRGFLRLNEKEIYFRIWIDMNHNSGSSDEEILDFIKPRWDFLMKQDATVESCLIQTEETVRCLNYYPAQIETLREVLYLTDALNDYFFNTIMQKNDVYQQFIADVPDAIKKRFNQKKQGELVLHFQTNMIGDFRNIFNVYNKMAPYIFINAYFEEILDGFLAFFSDKFDMELLFRKNFFPDAAKQWFLEKGFILPEGFMKNH